MFRFAYPLILILLPLLGVIIYRFRRQQRQRMRSLRIGSADTLREFDQPGHLKIILPDILIFLALTCLILSLARPQLGNVSRDIHHKGIDIMLALDISGSMQLNDFKPNRLEASKQVATDFVKGRRSDRIGLVVFAGESFLQCPLTSDYDVVSKLIREMKIVPQSLDGTAIGLAVSNCINRLRDTEAKSKVIILLTDGENNAGDIAPMTAASLAKEFGIKIYTIGMAGDGSQLTGGFLFSRRIPPLNEKLLKNIAQETGGSFYRADTEEKLKSIWDEISRLEKTDLVSRELMDWQERYLYFIIPAILFALAAFILKYIIWRRAIC